MCSADGPTAHGTLALQFLKWHYVGVANTARLSACVHYNLFSLQFFKWHSVGVANFAVLVLQTVLARLTVSWGQCKASDAFVDTACVVPGWGGDGGDGGGAGERERKRGVYSVKERDY
jgi:hypothetical protein